MEEIILPAQNLFDLLVVNSFYKFVPDCLIGYRLSSSNYEAIIKGTNLIDLSVKHSENVKKEIDNGYLFGICFRDNYNKYNIDKFENEVAKSGIPRWYAHEQKKEIRKNKKGIKEEFAKSPLIVTSGKGGNGDIFPMVQKGFSLGHYTEGRIKEMFGGTNVHKTCPNCKYEKCWLKASKCEKCKHEFKTNKITVAKDENFSSYTFNLVASYVSNTSNVVKCKDKKIATKSLFAATGLSLFSCYFAYSKLVVDGYNYRTINIPLSHKLINFSEWKLLIKNSSLRDWKKNREFWNKIANLLCVRKFKRLNLSDKKLDYFEIEE